MAADRGILAAVRTSGPDRSSLLASVRTTHTVVLAGLGAVIASGVLLLGADLDTYLASKLFWTKMALVALLIINGLVLTKATSSESLRWTAIASLTLWMLTTLAGTGLLNIG